MRIQSLTRAAAVLLCLGLVAIGGWFLLEIRAQPPAVNVADKATSFTLSVGKEYEIWTPNPLPQAPQTFRVTVTKTYSNGWIDGKEADDNSDVSINLANVTVIVRK